MLEKESSKFPVRSRMYWSNIYFETNHGSQTRLPWTFDLHPLWSVTGRFRVSRPGSSLVLSSIEMCIGTAEAEFVFTAMFHPSSLEVVIVRDASLLLFTFNSIIEILMKIALYSFIFARTENYLIQNRWMKLRNWVKEEINRRIFSIAWMIVWMCLECALLLRKAECYRRIG